MPSCHSLLLHCSFCRVISHQQCLDSPFCCSGQTPLSQKISLWSLSAKDFLTRLNYHISSDVMNNYLYFIHFPLLTEISLLHESQTMNPHVLAVFSPPAISRFIFWNLSEISQQFLDWLALKFCTDINSPQWIIVSKFFCFSIHPILWFRVRKFQVPWWRYNWWWVW